MVTDIYIGIIFIAGSCMFPVEFILNEYKVVIPINNITIAYA